jgi:peroxiredoxin family protein
MATAPLFILLASREHEKVQLAGMMASLAAVSERATQVLVSMAALLAFEKGLEAPARYQGSVFSEAMLEKGVPDAIDLFQQGRMLGDLRIYACSMALDVQGWTLDALVEDLFDEVIGLTKFLSDAEAGELVVF